MQLEFVKLNGLGNDFVFIEDMKDELDINPTQAKALCDRHFGIGADGVIVVKPPKTPGAAGYMHYINSDGTLAQMCGNGVRCFAKYLVDRGMADACNASAGSESGEASGVSKPSKHGQGSLIADTMAGPKPITYTLDDMNKMLEATVDMGKPILEAEKIPVNLGANAHGGACAHEGVDTHEGVSSHEGAGVELGVRVQGNANPSLVGDLELDSPWGTFSFTCVSMGNPHAVCFIDNWDALPSECFISSGDTALQEKSLKNFDVARIGAFFESHAAFPEKANIEFANVRPNPSPNSNSNSNSNQSQEPLDTQLQDATMQAQTSQAHTQATQVQEACVIDMRVFERGCGETFACGTGACATCVAAALTTRAPRTSDIKLLGGTLHINWADDDHVYMTGSAKESFTGTVCI